MNKAPLAPKLLSERAEALGLTANHDCRPQYREGGALGSRSVPQPVVEINGLRFSVGDAKQYLEARESELHSQFDYIESDDLSIIDSSWQLKANRCYYVQVCQDGTFAAGKLGGLDGLAVSGSHQEFNLAFAAMSIESKGFNVAPMVVEKSLERAMFIASVSLSVGKEPDRLTKGDLGG